METNHVWYESWSSILYRFDHVGNIIVNMEMDTYSLPLFSDSLEKWSVRLKKRP